MEYSLFPDNNPTWPIRQNLNLIQSKTYRWRCRRPRNRLNSSFADFNITVFPRTNEPISHATARPSFGRQAGTLSIQIWKLGCPCPLGGNCCNPLLSPQHSPGEWRLAISGKSRHGIQARVFCGQSRRRVARLRLMMPPPPHLVIMRVLRQMPTASAGFCAYAPSFTGRPAGYAWHAVVLR